MAIETLSAQTTREATSTPMREAFIAPKMLPLCCVCGLIRVETGSFPDREHWGRPRTNQTTHGLNPVDFPLTHTYCPKCLTQAMGTVRQLRGQAERHHRQDRDCTSVTGPLSRKEFRHG